jgi:large subunit ribosomal protein L18
LYAQIVDDARGHTLVQASSLDPDIKSKQLRGIETAKLIGVLLAQKAIQEGVTRVVFDRAGYRYHGRVKALADGAREGGLEF